MEAFMAAFRVELGPDGGGAATICKIQCSVQIVL
jgi:hypothetical protein